MGRTLLTVAAVVLLAAGCGGSHRAHASRPTHGPCAGYLTIKHPPKHFLVLFGALRKVTPRQLCGYLGAPLSVKHLKKNGDEEWRYQSGEFLLRPGRGVEGAIFH